MNVYDLACVAGEGENKKPDDKGYYGGTGVSQFAPTASTTYISLQPHSKDYGHDGGEDAPAREYDHDQEFDLDYANLCLQPNEDGGNSYSQTNISLTEKAW